MIDLGKLKLDDISPEQREVLKHIVTIDTFEEQESGVYLLRKLYYETWGQHGNGRNQ